MAKTSTNSKVKTEPVEKKEAIVTGLYPRTIDQRLHQIRFMMEDIKVDAMAVSYVPNIRYLTGFSGSSAFLFITPKEIHFVTDDRYEEQIKNELFPLPNMTVHINRKVWHYIAENDILKGIETLGFEADKMPYSEAVDIRNVIRPMKFKPAPNEIEPFNRAKSPEEIEFLRQAADMAEKAYQKFLTVVKTGMSEKEAANELVYICRNLGSEGDPFDFIVLSGPRTSLPHGAPSDRKIRKNEIIQVDFGCIVNGFCSDLSRSFVIGKPSKEQKSMYELVRKAQLNAINNVRPGINGQILDGFARNVIKDAGYGDNFKHSLGHGIGLTAHEKPLISFREDDQIVPENSVITIEPGVYFPEKFGIRIEDMVLTTRNGAVKLSNASDELIGI